MTRTSTRKPRKFTRAEICKLMLYLSTGNRTRYQVRRHMGCSHDTAARWVKQLHTMQCLHVVDYVAAKGNGYKSEVFAWGRGIDATKPVALTSTERVRKIRDRSTLDRAWRIAA